MSCALGLLSLIPSLYFHTCLYQLPGDAPSSMGGAHDPFRDIQGVSDLDEIMAEYGATTATSAELLRALPPPELCALLLQHFFEDINWMRQPLPQKSLRHVFDTFWASGPKLTAENINTYALLMFICAVASLSVDESAFPEGLRVRRIAARRFHYAGRKALLVSSMLGREDLDQVIAWNMSGRFLILDRRIGEAWTCAANAIKAGHSIGLHLDGEKLGLNPVETEARRRVWSWIYFSDRTLSMNLGRPTTIDDSVCDTLPPSDVDNQEVFPMPAYPPPLPEGMKPPTAMTYVRLRHGIAPLMGRIIGTFQKLNSPAHYSDILDIDREIEQYRASLPSYYRSYTSGTDEVHTDRSLDAAFRFLPAHRFLLETEINYIRIALHRPYLLRSGGTHGARYLPSRRACVDAARQDIALRRAYVQELREAAAPNKVPASYAVHIGSYKWFNSVLICGIALLIDPHGPDARELRACLEHFITVRQRKAKDDMSDREIRITQLFAAKADQLQKSGPQSAASANGANGVSAKHKRSRSSLERAENLTSPGTGSTAADGSGRASKAPRGQGQLTQNGAGHDDEVTDAHATAGLLLGLGQQGRAVTGLGDGANGSGSGNGSQNRQGSYDQYGQNALHPALSGTQQQTYAQQQQGSSYPSTWTPQGHRNSDSTSPAASTSTPNTGGGGSSSEDAQNLFDAWYRAEFAAGGSVLDAAFMQQPPAFSQSPSQITNSNYPGLGQSSAQLQNVQAGAAQSGMPSSSGIFDPSVGNTNAGGSGSSSGPAENSLSAPAPAPASYASNGISASTFPGGVGGGGPASGFLGLPTTSLATSLASSNNGPGPGSASGSNAGAGTGLQGAQTYAYPGSGVAHHYATQHTWPGAQPTSWSAPEQAAGNFDPHFWNQ